MSDDIAKLIAAINDHPDPAHGDYTPAVHALVRLGIAALPAVLPLLEADDAFTRLRAQRVLEGVTRAWVRARTPSLPMTRRADLVWKQLLSDNGSYDWQASAEKRAVAIAKWKSWVAKRPTG